MLVGVLLTGYAILDGFDLGVGGLHLLAKKDEHRRRIINAIGPVWDGNEVWLVTGGGALFAAFPEVYATAFSGFYIAFMLLLFALIFRAVAIEFRSKREGKRWWRRLLGHGLLRWPACWRPCSSAWPWATWPGACPLDANFRYHGDLLAQLHPYTVMTGLMVVAMFLMHGAIYLVMKTEGELNARVRTWVRPTIIGFIIMYVVVTMATLLYLPQMAEPFRAYPILFLVPALSVLAIANIPREIHLGRELRAFLSSCLAMALLLVLFGIGMFPELISSTPATIPRGA